MVMDLPSNLLLRVLSPLQPVPGPFWARFRSYFRPLACSETANDVVLIGWVQFLPEQHGSEQVRFEQLGLLRIAVTHCSPPGWSPDPGWLGRL